MLPISFTNSETQIDFISPKEIDGVGKREQENSIAEMEQNPENPFQFAISRLVDFSEEDGEWLKFSGGWLWRLRIKAPGAKSISLFFSKLIVPRDSKLWVYSLDGSSIQGPFAVRTRSSGRLRTPIVLGDDITIELFIPQEVLGLEEVKISLKKINPAFFNLFDDDLALPIHHCHVDVTCEEGDSFADQIRSVVLIEVDGEKAGTGTLLNNANCDGLPYIVTARHLGIDQFNADAVNFYWNHQSSSCGLRFGGSASENTSGSRFLASSLKSDFCLLVADTIPDPEFDVYYSGWDARGMIIENVTSIHHPLGQVKAIKSSKGTIRSTKRKIDRTNHDGNFWRVPGWENGSNEDLSSGSGLWSTEDKLLIGHHSAGFSTCENNSKPDWYGKFSASFGSMCTWLDPDAKSHNTLQGYDPERKIRIYQKLKGAKIYESQKALFANVHLRKKVHFEELNGFITKEKIEPFEDKIKDDGLPQVVSFSVQSALEMARPIKKNFRGEKVMTLLPEGMTPKSFLVTEESLDLVLSSDLENIQDKLDPFLFD